MKLQQTTWQNATEADLEQIDGLETIRAFGWSPHSAKSNQRAIQLAQDPERKVMSLQIWFNFVLDMLGSTIGVIVIIAAMCRFVAMTGGELGVALNTLFITTVTLQRLIESWSTLENSLGAISRLRKLEDETSWNAEAVQAGAQDGRDNFMVKGQLHLRNATASYQSENLTTSQVLQLLTDYRANTLALAGINLAIDRGQKVVIIGRTGRYVTRSLLPSLYMIQAPDQLSAHAVAKVLFFWPYCGCYLSPRVISRSTASTLHHWIQTSFEDTSLWLLRRTLSSCQMKAFVSTSTRQKKLWTRNLSRP